MFPLLLLLLLPLITCINTSSVNGVKCIEKERQALLTFKAGLVDDFNSLSSWSSEEGNQDCCNWEGVECCTISGRYKCSHKTGRVVGLRLPGHDMYSRSLFGEGYVSLRGNISSSLLELRELEFLDLSSNDFGFIPIPEFFGSFTKLQSLQLSNSSFAGTIPSQLGNLSMLYRLDLSFNLLDGMIPQSLGNLCNLKHLDLSYNDFGYMPIPDFFGSFGKLWSLQLSNSSFAGTIPSQLGNLSNLYELDLSFNLLDGMIPDSFGNLCNLRYLYLDNNNLTGNLSFVDNLSGCATTPALVELDLYSNQLNETLTKNLGTLSNLKELDLSSNSLNGLVSEAHFSNLTCLSGLHLSLNHLEFQISPQWMPPFQLKSIDLRSCKLGRSFPQWIRTQKTVQYLDISSSGISDSIPSWFWDLFERTTYLNLSSNKIGGILPDLSSKFAVDVYPGIDLSSNNFEGPIPLFPSSLASLNLSKNKFTGALSFLCQVSNIALTFLDISNNLLTGGLPDCLGKLDTLVVLNLAHNTLSGEIPSSVASLSSLETLYLYNNSFSGVLPKSLSNCTRLSFLDVGMNKFIGIVPSWIGGNMSRLYILSLRSNNFSGTIPSNLCQLTTLQVLDLSINNLSGSIPPCLNNISAMVQKGLQANNHMYSSGYKAGPKSYGVLDAGYISYHSHKSRGTSWDNNSYGAYTDYSVIVWQGSEREFGNNLKLLKIIDLSSNNLTGEIPDEITQLLELVALNLSRNALQGKVPQLIGQMKSLVSLDLSRNMLSYKIPTSLSNLHFLGNLDLSYNKFSGKIPSGTQLQTFNASCYIGNVGLCGPPLTSKCPGEEPPPLVVDSGDSKEDNDEYDKGLYIGMAVGFVTGFWGICGALLLNRCGRHAFFLFVDDLKDWCYVKIAVK